VSLKRTVPEARILLFSVYSSLIPEKVVLAAGISAVVPKGARLNVLLEKARSLINQDAA
jgi:hypothetical protein